MLGLPLAFAAPAVLVALVGLGALYYLLRVTPPTPRRVQFPPLRLLLGLAARETEPARTPWPILALRLAVAALIILAMAQPLWRSLAAPHRIRTAARPRRRRLAGGADLRQADRVCARSRWRRRRAPGARSRSSRSRKPPARSRRSNAGEIEGRLRSLAPAPYSPSKEAALPAIERFLGKEPSSEVLWIADGVELGGANGFASGARGVSPAPSTSSPTGQARAPSPAPTTRRDRSRARLVRSDAAGRRDRQCARARPTGTGDRPRAFRLRRQARGRRPFRPAGRAAQRGAEDRRSTATARPARRGSSTIARAAGGWRSPPEPAPTRRNR